MPMSKFPVAILGATGAVGQRLIALLANHPWFEIGAVCASERSEGKPYGEAVRWLLSEDPPEAVLGMTVRDTRPIAGIPFVCSALAADIARDVEPAWAMAGAMVSSNASAFRMADDVPLIIPEVNPDHLELLEIQRKQRGFGAVAGIITNPNCSAIGLVMALCPLQRRFGVAEVVVTTLQAVSGAGYPGVPSLDALANVIPFIPGEETKIENETRKLLGASRGDVIEPAPFRVSAMVNRVPVIDGHMASVSVRLEREATLAEVRDTLAEFRGEPQRLRLPSAPAQPVVVLDRADRPQPLRDVMRGAGMTATVGGLRECAVNGLKFSVLSHNTLRGAAGAALLNLELWLAKSGRAPG